MFIGNYEWERSLFDEANIDAILNPGEFSTLLWMDAYLNRHILSLTLMMDHTYTLPDEKRATAP